MRAKQERENEETVNRCAKGSSEQEDKEEKKQKECIQGKKKQ